MGVTYYIDNITGSDQNNGLSPETAAKSYKTLPICAGDTVLFRRGCVFYETLNAVSGSPDGDTIYSAYGEGASPEFSHALLLDNPQDWCEFAPNVWQFKGKIHGEVGCLFSDYDNIGRLCWEYSDLQNNGDWYFSEFATVVKGLEVSENAALYIYCEDNPTNIYKKLKASLYFGRGIVTAKHFVTIKGLNFSFGGCHGFATIDATNIKIIDCNFKNIGGAVWNKERKIRFGNAIEFWEEAENILVEGCCIDNVYDSCMTHQGGKNYKTPRNIVIKNNRFSNFGMAAYELRDKITYDTYFINNVCENAGVGLCVDYDTPPRQSEIYPQPMGHHLFIWRINEPTPNAYFEISGNTFGFAACGSAIYSIINQEAFDQIIFKNNNFVFSNEQSIYMNDKYISLKEFNER